MVHINSTYSNSCINTEVACHDMESKKHVRKHINIPLTRHVKKKFRGKTHDARWKNLVRTKEAIMF